MIELQEIVRQYPLELQKSDFYDQMVKEYIHHQMLQSLYTGIHAGKINFLGGTALRYFYNNKRFSEDLDFDCIDLSREEFNEMTDRVKVEIQRTGISVEIEDKEKYKKLNAFRRVFVFPELRYKLGLSQQKEAKFFIKIEAEPQGFQYVPDIKILNGFNITLPIKLVPLDILFSSKVATALKRKKDRDFFDVISLITFSKPNFKYLEKKCKINSPELLKNALINAAIDRKLDTRTLYDCEHMLFNIEDKQKISSFLMNIKSIDFNKFDDK